MIVAFKISENFVHSKHYPALLAECRSFAAALPDTVCEFYYYLQSKEVSRWFIIRGRAADTEQFVRAARSMAINLGFEILTKEETVPLLAND